MWDASKTAFIICDMWDQHWCKGATQRVTEMAPRMNRVIAAARARGATIIHAPSECMAAYQDHPARRRALQAPAAPDVPEHLRKWAEKLPSEANAVWPIDQSDGGCDCEPKCPQAQPWRAQTAALEIQVSDAITDSGAEVWNLLKQRGIEHVVLLGVHTNMCVIGRPFGLRNLKRAGVNVVLMRDLTDTMYNSRCAPHVPHFTGTDRIVRYIEQYVCPTITSPDLVEGPPFRFPGDARPHVVFLIGEQEYKTRETLPAYAAKHLEPRGLRCTFIHASSDTDEAQKHTFPGFEALAEADLLWVSVRRRAPPQAQLDLLRAHLAAGKPLIGIRTASHAFDAKGKAPEGHAEWKDFDPAVLGGNYHGHYGQQARTVVTLAPDTKAHPVLQGVEGYESASWLYKVRPLARTAAPLLLGTYAKEEAEPVAWTNEAQASRIFYTSLGHWEDFENPSFIRLLINATFWALKRPVPERP